jgi:type 2 lantibiotic biosynthesis protein LanM
VAGGSEADFAVRLAWDGLQRADSVLGSVRWSRGRPLPAWTRTLREIARGVARGARDRGLTPIGEGADALPFEELTSLVVDVARGRLLARDRDAFSLFSPEAQASVERALRTRVTEVWAPTLYLELSVFLGTDPDDDGPPANPGSRIRYLAFLEQLCGDGLRPFFLEYAFLGRLLARTVDLWVEATAELVGRLRADQEALGALTGCAAGRVVGIEPSLSDPHHGGRAVCTLTFESGKRVVYKPRSVGIERAFLGLLAWCSRQDLRVAWGPVAAIDRGDYGWVEAVPQVACQSAAEVTVFYRQGGVLLGLVHALGGNDMHDENLVAHGDRPVPVDLEMVLQPPAVEEPRSEADVHFLRVRELLARSVCHTGLLPEEALAPDGKTPYDAGGLAAMPDPEVCWSASTWLHVNTDAMTLSFEPRRRRPRRNAPTLRGAMVEPAEYVDDVLDGFRAVHRCLREHRAELLGPGGAITALREHEVRFVLRPTREYADALRGLFFRPLLLREGVDFSIELEGLGRDVLLDLANRDRYRPLLAAEQRALADLDVPVFRLRAGDDSLPVHGERLAAFFAQSPYDRARSLVLELDDVDLATQTSHIRGTFLTRRVRQAARTASASRTPVDTSTAPLSAGRLAERAVAIAESLSGAVVRLGEGASWFGIEGASSAPCRYGIVGFGLYEGCAGIALFLAAAAALTGDASFGALARAAVRPIRQVVASAASDPERLLGDLPLGVGAGIGSLVYALLRVGIFLGDGSLIEDARLVASWVDADRVAADENLDVIGGSAGAILALLALDRQGSCDSVLERAVTCGDHLLAARVPVSGGARAWPSAEFDGEPVTGFSHGAAGIVCALLMLHRATSERRFLDAAREAMRWERSLLSVPTRRPRRSRRPEPAAAPSRANAWCHGAAGVGLGRLGGLVAHEDAGARRDIDAVVDAIGREPLGPTARLCCGDFGRIETLVVAARRLEQPALLRAARQRASQILALADHAGGFELIAGVPPPESGPFMPGLFTGISGIGYELLRLAHPDRFPSVLLFD